MQEVLLLMWMNCCLFARYDLNQETRRERRMEWLMVSKAAMRSRRMRMLRCPQSAERRAVPVPCRE